MLSREQLNEQHYRQAVRFAENFDDEKIRQEFLREQQERHLFEQAQLQREAQKMAEKRPLAKQSFLLFGLISAIAVAIYTADGRFTTARTADTLHRNFQQQTAESEAETRNDRYIVSLQNRLRDNPNDGDLWFELGQAYALNNDFDSALICYRNAEKVLGEKASIFGAMATADYYEHKQQLTPQAQHWISRALALDANDTAALLLLASDRFLHNDFQAARNYWQRVLDSENQAIDRRAIIESMRMADQMMQGMQ